jgi:hypothetical protein
MTQRDTIQKGVAIILLLLACAFLLAGAVLRHKVYDSVADDFGIPAFLRISERQLVIDSTFSGVERKNGRLYSTYDRSQPRAKRSCPT